MSICWFLLSSGQGPAECQHFVALLLQRLQATCPSDLQCQLLEAEPGEMPHTYRSVLLSFDGPEARRWIQSWCGTLQWICTSPYRPTHRRKNWFVSGQMFSPPPENTASLKDVRFETSRSGGPGGQNVNKVETAVRVIHLPSGLSVTAREERSQYRNRQLALARLAEKLAAGEEQQQQRQRQSQWQAHHQLQRGSAIRVFKGLNLQEQPV